MILQITLSEPLTQPFPASGLFQLARRVTESSNPPRVARLMERLRFSLESIPARVEWHAR